MSELPLTFTCDAILFDMDGTLIDSTAVVERQWRRWAALHQLDADRILAVSHGRKTIDTMREVAPHLELTVEDAACFDEAEGRDGDGVAPIAGAAQILSSLRDGQWAVVTSAGTQLTGIRFRQAGLPLPPVLVSADDVHRGKPDPEGYALAARRLGFANERCLVIEDTPPGIAAGRAAGMQVLAIGATVPRESLPDAPWIPDLTRLRITGSHPLTISVARPGRP